MAKKSKAERLYAKQLQRVEKLQKKAKQKGVSITLPEVKNTTKVTAKEVTSIKRDIKKIEKTVEEAAKNKNITENILRDLIQKKVEEGTRNKKISEKALREGIQKRRRRIAEKTAEEKQKKETEKKAEGAKNKKISEKSLREAIQKRRKQIAEKSSPPEPGQLKPKTPEELFEEEVKRGIRIIDFDEEEPETKEQRKAQAEEERNELMPGDMEKVPDKVNRDPDFFSNAVIKQFEDMIKQFPRNAEPLLNAWLEQLIESQGKDAVATMLQNGAAEGHVVNREIAYSMDKIQSYISDMLNYLPEMTDWYKAEIMEQFETFDTF